MGKNIVLIGMPGVGKSTSGVILAKVLNYDFLDSDLVIQHQTGKLLKEIIAEKDRERILLGRYTKTERSYEIFQKLCLVIRKDIPNCGDFFYMPRY